MSYTTDKIQNYTEKEVKLASKLVERVSKNYMVLKIGYNSIALPYKDGVTILAALERATAVETYYSNSALEIANEKISIETTHIDGQTIQDAKVLHLLTNNVKAPDE